MSRLLVLLLAAGGLAACGDDMPPAAAQVSVEATSQQAGTPAETQVETPPVQTEVAEPVPAEYTGDLDQIRERGTLRILIPANVGGAFYLPRTGWPVELQHEAAEDFARSQGLEPQLVPVARFSEMLPSLLAGKGDIIAANLTVTEKRRAHIAFSVPLTTVRQQVLVARDRPDIASEADLDGKRLMVDRGSSFWERLEAMQEDYPDMQLVARPEGMSDEDELDAVAAGEVDASVRDSNVAGMYLGYRDDLKLALSLAGTDDIAWGVRQDSPKLREALNKFLHLEALAGAKAPRFTDGVEGISKRRVLRMLLPNNAASYFLYKGELHGFEYELAKAFADANKWRLEVIVPDTHEQLIEWLLDGRGDVAAGFLEPSDELAARGVGFSKPYHFAPRHLVVHADNALACRRDLAGRTVTVRRSSPYWKDLEALQASGVDFTLQAAAEDIETEELIAQVASGDIEATVADGHLLDIELARGLPVKSAFQISDERAHAVAVRAGNKQLLARLDEFIKKEYRGTVYNILYKKYFTNPRAIRNLAAGRLGSDGNAGLSPYDEIIRKYAERYGFDWRLITAQMFQESRFDPDAKSFAGARGLMQVMPRTAKFMGFGEIEAPEEGIHAGIKYLDWVRNRFEETLPFSERMWFTLAAYNAGHGHVGDARRLARQQGLDADRWFDNVEQAMLLLSKKQFANKARYGYVRGVEPVSYVRNIRTRYRAYAEIVEKRLARGAETVPGARLADEH